MTIDPTQIKYGDLVTLVIEGTVKRTIDHDGDLLIEYPEGIRTKQDYFSASMITAVEPGVPTAPNCALLSVGLTPGTTFYSHNARNDMWVRKSDGLQLTWEELWKRAKANGFSIRPVEIGDPIG